MALPLQRQNGTQPRGPFFISTLLHPQTATQVDEFSLHLTRDTPHQLPRAASGWKDLVG